MIYISVNIVDFSKKKPKKWEKWLWILIVGFYNFLYDAKYVAKKKNSISHKKFLQQKIVKITTYFLIDFCNFGCNQPLMIIVGIANIKYIVLVDIVYVS